MARAPASAPAPPPWPDSRRAPRGGGPSQPPPRPGTPPQTPGTPPSAPHDPSAAGTPLPPVCTPEIAEPPPGVSEAAAAPPGDPESPAPPGGVAGGSRRVLFADALGLPLTRLRQYRPWDPRGRGGPPGGGGGGGTPGRGEGGTVGEPPPPGIWMRPGKGRPQEAEDVQPPPPEHSTEPDPAPAPPPDAEQPPAQGTEDEAVARELEQLYLSHLRRLRGDPNDSDPIPKNGGPPFPDRAPNTSLANEMALRYEGGGGGRCSPPVLLGTGGPLEGALVVPARPPRGRGSSLGGALRGCGVVLALAVLVPVAWGGDGGGPTAAVALGIYLALAWLT
ncbi:proline-rich proteoglycan 2-like [Molothrus aeneus]|uniref:proline-rich proteoglycan 2-like n=1 Tax=Molothrus aeneus TaxID=84833 RepID=UPI00345A9C57